MDGEISTMKALWSSLGLLLAGYSLGTPIGVGLGLLLGLNPVVYWIGRLLLQLPAALPAIALIPVLLIYLNTNPNAPRLSGLSQLSGALPSPSVSVLTVAYAALWAPILPVAIGMRQARSGGRLMPNLFLGLKFSLAMAWFTVIAVEFLVSLPQGLGIQMWTAYNTMDLTALVDGLLAAMIVGFLLQLLLDLVEFGVSFLRRQAPQPTTEEDLQE